MALDLTGIYNENEFYSQHYLDELLERDLKGVFQKWKEDKEKTGDKTPVDLIRGLSRDYFEHRARIDKASTTADRLRLQRQFSQMLLEGLGYSQNLVYQSEDGVTLPLLSIVEKSSGAPQLWLLEALESGDDADSLLDLPIHPAQLNEEEASTLDLAKLINDAVFFRDEPPRWVIVAGFSQLLLLDRSKWAARRAIRFDLEEIFNRREDSTLRSLAALLHRDSLCPADGLSLLDTLDENSHKHAYEVSGELKYAIREAIELLGNEIVRYKRDVRREKIYERDLAGELTAECLRYMYRLLFLFYVEARPELNYAPLKADAYRDGYSLEKLRDLEMVRLDSESAQNGFFLDTSIRRLFGLIYDGFTDASSTPKLELEGLTHYTFQMPPLQSHLFDPERTPLINSVKLRNCVVQKIIRLMSLSSESGKRRGRISYAQLGINQLGAVYEALLSYRGFFAETDLYEVRKKREKRDLLKQAYFVAADALEDYDEEEKVFEKDGSLVVHPQGTFIYRLAGRDREKSASYYTPEVLTKCLVKYALKELLKDKSADEVLELTICEPAMGSAAFLNEAISQLADAYLQRKQSELGETLSPDEYTREKQRVKMYLADNNIFGVDLNPVAVELAEVSLWLNTLVPGGFVPWFGNQLKCGNSLVGARSQVFKADSLRKASGDTSWLKTVPEDVPVGKDLPLEAVYHFLVPDAGMAAYRNKVIKGLVPDGLAHIKTWRKSFLRAFSEPEIKRLHRLSRAVERLWQRHVSELKRIDARTSDAFLIYGHPADPSAPPLTTTREKDRILEQELYSQAVRNSSPYRRLKLVMDYWCALWFWPIEKAHLLPSREEYIADLELLLVGKEDIPEAEVGEQVALFADTMPRQLALQLRDELGYVDIEALLKERPRLALVAELGKRYRFHHWHLEFADQFAARDGFDLVLGNPPWIQTHWNEGGVLGDVDPFLVIKKHSATQLAALRNEAITNSRARKAYFAEFEEAQSTQEFLNANQNYAILEGC